MAIATSQVPSLDVENVSKTFGTTTVLRNANLQIQPGEIHALIGANGAGKSTLVRCITGVYHPDAGGVVKIAGQPAPTHYSPGIAADMGVRVVHQEAPVVGILTVAEVGGLQRGFPKLAGTLVRWRKLHRETRRILARLNIAIPPSLHAGRLTAGQRAMVMLAFALADVEIGAKLLVLDEPTASLPAHDANRFLSAVQQTAQYGVGIMLVTHRLSEIFAIANRVTVLRDGEIVWVGQTADTSHDELVEELVGNESAGRRDASIRDDVRRSKRFEPKIDVNERLSDAPLLKVDGLSGETISNVSFSLEAGELVGVTGIMGSGASELGRLIAGVAHRREGMITLAGRELPVSTGPRQALQRGIAYVPADRLIEGGVPVLSVRENIALPRFGDYWLKGRIEDRDVREVLTVLDVRPPNPRKRFRELSGGNQQKVIIGKWALLRPKLFILDDPTTGVDPGAREELYAVLRGLLEAGTGILFISSEPEQLERLASRVLVLRRGVISAELQGENVTEAAITRASL